MKCPQINQPTFEVCAAIEANWDAHGPMLHYNKALHEADPDTHDRMLAMKKEQHMFKRGCTPTMSESAYLAEKYDIAVTTLELAAAAYKECEPFMADRMYDSMQAGSKHATRRHPHSTDEAMRLSSK